jgi:hypothetical protein
MQLKNDPYFKYLAAAVLFAIVLAFVHPAHAAVRATSVKPESLKLPTGYLRTV